jgi:hypothetical protein
MKLAKTIAIITLSVLLAISAFFNIFITSMLEIKDVKSFKQVLLCRELIESMGQLSEDTTNTDKPETPNVETPVPEVQTKEPNEEMIIYNANGVKISYVAQELGLMGPSLKFYVENNTNQTLDICLTDIYIDGFKADLSGMYCSSLGAGKKAYESLTLYEFEYEDFSDFPSVIEFVVKIQDSTSWNTIVETKPMYLCLD